MPAARRFVRQVLRDQPVEIVDAAELLASELATNSIRHAHTDFELAIHARDQIRIEVRDKGSGQPRLLSPGVRESAGRGLLIVDSMADEWGVVPAAGGKVVWFTLPQRAGAGEESGSRDSRRERSDGGQAPTRARASGARLRSAGREPPQTRGWVRRVLARASPGLGRR